MPLQAAYWSNQAQKFQFIADAGPTMTLQNNPSSYSLSPNAKNATVLLPATMGPSYLNGYIEYPPTDIPMQWSEITEADYIQLATYFHMKPCTMIDMNDQGYYGSLKLDDFDYNVGSAQKVGSAKAVFVASTPADGVNSRIYRLPNPGTLTCTVSTGGSIPSNTVLYYLVTFFSAWGEGLGSQVATVNTGNVNNALVTIKWVQPTSAFFHKARVYVASSAAGLLGGTMCQFQSEIWYPFSQQWSDPCGLNNQYLYAPVPTLDKSYTGEFLGGRWVNLL